MKPEEWWEVAQRVYQERSYLVASVRMPRNLGSIVKNVTLGPHVKYN